jgi:hypothetical protein
MASVCVPKSGYAGFYDDYTNDWFMRNERTHEELACYSRGELCKEAGMVYPKYEEMATHPVDSSSHEEIVNPYVMSETVEEETIIKKKTTVISVYNQPHKKDSWWVKNRKTTGYVAAGALITWGLYEVLHSEPKKDVINVEVNLDSAENYGAKLTKTWDF